MMGIGAGSALSAGGRKLIQLAIMGGIGVTALGAYGYTNPDIPGLQFVKDHRALIIAIGVGAIALGAMVSWYSTHLMTKKMMSGMSGMGGMGTMPGMMGSGGGFQMPAAAPEVKVKCRSCKALNAEDAEFCSKCGKPLA